VVPGGLVLEAEDGHQRDASTHVVPPDKAHRHGPAEAAAVLWVDQDDVEWALALENPRDISGRFEGRVRRRLDERMTPEEAREVARALLDVVATADGARERTPRHPAVLRMCALLDSTASEREMRVTQLAQRSGLSPRQLRHRFTEELGINPSAYLRWRRLRRAVTCIERDATLTEAAVEGGFADGAHFSRVFQAQFGMAPSQALSSARFGGRLV
jgi:AraC-like DNA-binding protein